MASELGQLLATYAQLINNAIEAGQNPISVLQDSLESQLYLKPTFNFKAQLCVIVAVLSLCLLLLATSFIIRISRARKDFFIVRLYDINGDRYILPHWTAGWSLVALIFVCVLEGLFVALFRYLNSDAGPNFLYWVTLPWTIGWLGGFVATWSLTISFLAQLSSSGKLPDTRLVSAPFINTIALVLPILHLATILPLSCLAGRSYAKAFGDYTTLQELLGKDAAAYDPKTFSITSLLSDLGPAEALLGDMAQVEKWLRTTFIVYIVWSVLLGLCLLSVAIPNVLMISSTLKFHKRSSGQKQQGSSDQPIQRRRNGQSMQTHALQRSLWNLRLTIVIFTVIDLIICGAGLLIVADNSAFFTNSNLFYGVLLWFLYTWSIFGLAASVLLLLRSFERAPSSKVSTGVEEGSLGKLSGSGAGAPTYALQLVKVNTEVVVDVDQEEAGDIPAMRERK